MRFDPGYDELLPSCNESNECIILVLQSNIILVGKIWIYFACKLLKFLGIGIVCCFSPMNPFYSVCMQQ